jgi:acyl-coenzyme A synthetase/AMP-(fatty) acid ligase/3-hydroxymyristoyl/3-hydroxydecanoyl-(acyl carrier protein) dehydratase
MIALHDVLLGTRAADTPVCRDGAAVLDFADFRARVQAFVAVLSVQPARRYALCINDPFDFACALLALFACGKEPVIPANAAPGYLADLSDAYDVALTDADTPRHGVPPASEYPIDPQAPLTLYTSGSSGAPKPIRKTLAQFSAEVHTLEKQWGALAGNATVLGSVPHHHIYGLLFRLLWPLAAGRPFDRAISIEPQHLQARIAQCGPSVVVSTPAQLSRWPALHGFATLSPAPRAFFSSGGPLAADAASEYAAAFGAAPVEIYGSTETGGIAWRRQDESDAWQPLNGIEVHRGNDGALTLRSPHLDHDDWHRTDDAIAFDTDGRFRLQGRLDRVLKLDGKRVSLPELEARLALHPYVAQAAVVPLEGMSRERIGALVALTEAGSEALLERGRVLLAKTLRRHLAAYFDIVVLPRHWRFRFALPFDARGKLPAAALAAAFGARADGVEVLSEARSGTTLRYELRVPPTLVHFAGHFPGLPILPGVVQVDWAMRLAAEHVVGVRALASIDRLKFKAPVPPGALLALTLTPDASRQRVQFAYRLDEQDCASGLIVYRESA